MGENGKAKILFGKLIDKYSNNYSLPELENRYQSEEYPKIPTKIFYLLML
jgi:hypothetical protein